MSASGSSWSTGLCGCICYAMCGDRGIGECFGVELDLPGTIAKGDPTCQLRYIRRKV